MFYEWGLLLWRAYFEYFITMSICGVFFIFFFFYMQFEGSTSVYTCVLCMNQTKIIMVPRSCRQAERKASYRQGFLKII